MQQSEKALKETILMNAELLFQVHQLEKLALELDDSNMELQHELEKKLYREAELITANAELHYKHAEVEKRYFETAVAHKELAQITRISSHDLLEPVRIIQGYMKALEEDYELQLDKTAFRYIDSAKAAAEKMSRLITALMNFSRLGQHKKLSRAYVKDLVAGALFSLQLLISSSRATIVVEEMPYVNVYEMEFSQLLQHLIANAITYSKTDTPPHIYISWEKCDGCWKFMVKDNGIGIVSAHFDRIFDIFQRLHIDSEHEGTGIGLAECKKIVEFHGGTIWVESELGTGTTVNFTISELHL